MNAEIQNKVNAALNALSIMTNQLNVLNIEMALIPATGPMGEKFQAERVAQQEAFSTKIIALANEVGDYFNDIDIYGDEDLALINPMFEFINKK